jgi:lysine 6-dehydrogenase
MSYVYAVLGGGRQGTAAAHNMAKFGDPKEAMVSDISLAAAEESAARVNQLVGKKIVTPELLDVPDKTELVRWQTIKAQSTSHTEGP